MASEQFHELCFMCYLFLLITSDQVSTLSNSCTIIYKILLSVSSGLYKVQFFFRHLLLPDMPNQSTREVFLEAIKLQ